MILFLFIGFMSSVRFVQWIYETSCNEPKTRKYRLRRVRFAQLEAEHRLVDPFARSFTSWYNDKCDDPDIAITVFRNCPGVDNIGWWDYPPDLYLPLR